MKFKTIFVVIGRDQECRLVKRFSCRPGERILRINLKFAEAPVELGTFNVDVPVVDVTSIDLEDLTPTQEQ